MKLIRHRKTNTILFYLYVESKNQKNKIKFMNMENRLVVARGEKVWGRGAKRVSRGRNFHYKVNKSWACNVQHW